VDRFHPAGEVFVVGDVLADDRQAHLNFRRRWGRRSLLGLRPRAADDHRTGKQHQAIPATAHATFHCSLSCNRFFSLGVRLPLNTTSRMSWAWASKGLRWPVK